MGRRSGKSGSDALVGVAVVVGAIALLFQFVLDLLKQAWPVLVMLAVLAVTAWVVAWFVRDTSNERQDDREQAGQAPNAVQPAPDKVRSAGASNPPMISDFAHTPVSVTRSASAGLRYSLPRAPQTALGVAWVPPGGSVEVDGRTVAGGMLYIGRQSGVPSRERDPAVIDVGLSFAGDGDYRIGGMGYWPSFSVIDARQRRAYIAWLASGRSHPDADIGYVFLFFYGLERRCVIDAATDAAAVAELNTIRQEVVRLLGIYGKSASVRRYARRLIEWIDLMLLDPDHIDLDRLLVDARRGTVPMTLRAVMGRMAMRKQPLPAAMALAWVRLDTTIPMQGAIRRSPQVFEQHFQQRYAEAFGDGLTLPTNRTKLQLEYAAASSALAGRRISFDFNGVPDVTAVKAPIMKLAQLVERVNADLQPTLKSSAAAAAAGDDLGAWLGVAARAWPDALRVRVEKLSERLGQGVTVTTLGALVTELGGTAGGATLPIAYTRTLAERLAEIGIGVEPDVLAGVSVRKTDATIVLFGGAPTNPTARTRADYRAAQLMLDLASAVAAADGAFGPQEMMHLTAQLRSWTHLSEGLRARLRAYLRLRVAEPASLTGLKKRIEPLPAKDREAIAEFMLAVAHADGMVDASEVKMLERAYRALGIDATRVFKDLHVTAAGDGTRPVAAERAIDQQGEAAFTLDKAKVAQLQGDTAKVAQLLSTIFTEENQPEEIAPVQDEAADDAGSAETDAVMGLDAVHTQFVRLLLQREFWTRADAADMAADLGVMLDGALERMNDAAFEAHGMPLLEGDDPLHVNQDIREALEG